MSVSPIFADYPILFVCSDSESYGEGISIKWERHLHLIFLVWHLITSGWWDSNSGTFGESRFISFLPLHLGPQLTQFRLGWSLWRCFMLLFEEILFLSKSSAS